MVKTENNQYIQKKFGKTIDISVKPKYTIIVTKRYVHKKGNRPMGKKKKSGKDHTLTKLVLATSIIQLIQAIIELIEHLLE